MKKFSRISFVRNTNQINDIKKRKIIDVSYFY